MSDTPNNIVKMRDFSENVLETLERVLVRMRQENPTGLGYEVGVLVTMTKEGRLEMCRLGANTSRLSVLGALDVAKDIIMGEVADGGQA